MNKTRKGPGRPLSPYHTFKIPVGYKLPRWMVEWIRSQNRPASQLIEDALIEKHKLKPPPTKKA